MHSQLALIVAQEQIADRHRAADHNRLVHAATTTNCGNEVSAPRHTAVVPVPFLRWLRRRVA